MQNVRKQTALIDLVFHAPMVTTLIAGLGVSLGAFPLEGMAVTLAVALGFYIPIGLMVVAAIAESVALVFFAQSGSAVVERLIQAARFYRHLLNVAAGIFVVVYVVPPLLAFFLR